MIKSIIRNNRKFFIISVITSLVASLAPIFATKDLETEILRNGENLSGGEKQRVAIARSLMKEADVYIFDEITSNLDDVSQVEFFNEMMADLAGKIIFIVSHDKSVEAFTNKKLPL